MKKNANVSIDLTDLVIAISIIIFGFIIVRGLLNLWDAKNVEARNLDTVKKVPLEKRRAIVESAEHFFQRGLKWNMITTNIVKIAEPS